jgi:glycogen synthase
VRVLMLVATSVTTDARVLREASTLADAGHDVHIVGKDVPPDPQPPSGVVISTASAGRQRHLQSDSRRLRSPSAPRRAIRWLLLPEYRSVSFGRWARAAGRVAADLDFDVVHAHDFTALALGNRLSEQRNVPLIYDSHELWSQRHRSGRPIPLQKAWERRSEKRLGDRATAVLTVGEGLAAKLRALYGWKHVTVVRNSFPGPDQTDGGRPTRPQAALYAGRLAAGRDLETVAAASRSVALPVRLLGPADESWAASFDPGRCTVDPPVELSEVDNALRTAGLALVPLSDKSGNHRIALPNKLFHAVRTRVPVVASDVGELGKTVRAYGLGVLYRPGDVASFARAIDEAVARYAELVAAVGRAGEELSWDADAKALLKVYMALSR